MPSYTLIAKLAELGSDISFSGPHVSNINLDEESLYRILKYH